MADQNDDEFTKQFPMFRRANLSARGWRVYVPRGSLSFPRVYCVDGVYTATTSLADQPRAFDSAESAATWLLLHGLLPTE